MNKLNLKNRPGLRAVIVIGFLYLLLWLILPKPAFWGIDNGFKYQGARQFANTGSVLIEYSGAEFDPEGAFRSIIPPFGLMRGDKIAPVFSVLFMIFAGILYKVFGPVGPFLLPLFGGWISLIAGAFLWRRVSPGRHPVFFLTMLGLGTPLLFYSLALWEHALATALIIVSFAMIVPERGSRISFGRWEPIIAGA